MEDLSIFTNLEDFRLDIPTTAPLSPGQSTVPSDSRLSNDDGGLDGFFYIPNFISIEEERYLLQKIDEAPQPKWKVLQHRRLQHWGGQLSSQNTLIPESLPSFLVRYPPLLERIKQTSAFAESSHGIPNHCLVNEYLPGQGIMPHEDGSAYFPAVATVSLGSHTLLDLYRWAEEDESSHPQVSEQIKSPPNHDHSHKIRAREQAAVCSILQEPRSLLITAGSAYRDFLHGIAERDYDDAEHLAIAINRSAIADHGLRLELDSVFKSPECRHLPRSKRVSLTFRDVEKVSKGLSSIFARR